MSGAGESNTIAGLWKTTLEEGQTWYLVEQKWFKKWCRYSGFNPRATDVSHAVSDMHLSEEEKPGRIENEHLIEENSPALRKNLQESVDYSLVIKEVWDQLFAWYGGGPAIARQVITFGMKRETRLDFYPVTLKIVKLGSNGEPDDSTAEIKTFSSKDTFQKVVNQYAKAGNASGAGDAKGMDDDDDDDNQANNKKFRIWFKEQKKNDQGQVIKEKWVVVKDNSLNQALEAFEFTHEAVVWLDQKGADWQRSHIKQDFRNFEVGDTVDCLDSVKKWYESTIREVNEAKKQVLVHFNGWDSKWDEWLPFDSDRIDKQNAHTTGPYMKSSSTGSNFGGSGGYYSGWSSYSASNDEGRPTQKGVVGLRNLGNTCFMNSMLQCMSNTQCLTEYFVEDQFAKDINRDNPLGWQGRIADEYGAMLKEMWSDKYRVVAPAKFKKVLGEFAPRFSGYQQQDSSELLSFLLDGLHEDLNLVKKKPATQPVENDGRPDKEVADESWKTYLMRNQSKIVDTFQGQLKSTVTCPDCKRISITFDPYMFLSVPLPQVVDKVQQLTFVPADPNKPLLQIFPKVAKVSLMHELRTSVSKLLGVPEKRLAFADVWKNRIHSLMKEDDSVGDIRSTDTVFVYELADLDELPPAKARIISVSQYVSKAEYRDAAALPILIVLPKDKDNEPTTKMVRERIDKQVRAFLKPEHSSNPYTIVMTDGYGSCAVCEYSKRCTGCEVPKDNMPISKLDTRTSQLSFAVQWNNDGADLDQSRFTIQQHESVKNANSSSREDASLDVYQCIQAFTQQETLGENDAWYCSKCKKHQQATKKFDVWKLPNILIVHLKRFSYSRIWREKISTNVDFPDVLDMANYVVNPEEKQQDTTYELFAVSNHMGGMGGGHYTAYAKNCLNDHWYLFDDSSTHEVNPSQVKSSSAYVLFYKRKTNKAAK